MDMHFTCDCSDTEFIGSNCEVQRLQNSASSRKETDTSAVYVTQFLFCTSEQLAMVYFLFFGL